MLLMKMREKCLAILMALFGTLICQPVLADSWQSSALSSDLEFIASYQGLPINGRFNRFSVAANTDQATQLTQLDVRVFISSADMGSSEINQAIQTTDWFNSGDFSEAIFTSQHLETVSRTENNAEYIAHGELQLKGLKNSIAVPLSWKNNGSDQVVIAGELTLDRSDFGIGIGEWASGEQIGLAVRVSFTVQLDRINE